jgi:enterochelin esterase-like enzyme/pimeloyl-ACP methyl ester carboxylesterase
MLTLLLLLVPQPPSTPSAAELIVRQEKEKAHVWLDGETLTFFHRGEADSVQVIFGGDQVSLKRIAGSDAWYQEVKKPGVKQGFFSYMMMPMKGNIPPAKLQPQFWRGPEAPALAEQAKPLVGKVTEYEFNSKHLGTMRKLSVYEPPIRLPGVRPAVLYCADGLGTSGYAAVVEPLIVQNKIPPVVIVGLHTAQKARAIASTERVADDPRQDERAREYLPSIDPEHFQKHERYFIDEVLPWAEHTLGVARHREQRAVHGRSNGARFAVTMGQRHPDLFGQVMAFSVAGKPEKTERLQPMPMFHLTAGTWEEAFHRITQMLANELEEQENPVCFTTYPTGHDVALWQLELTRSLVRAWGTPSVQFDNAPLPFPFQRFTTTDRYGRTITAYLSSPPKEPKGDLPMVLWIGGSGSQSLFHKSPEGSIGGGMQNLLQQLSKGRYRVLCVEKPGVQYLDWPKRPGSAEDASEAFKQEHTLPRWGEANVAALRAVWQLPGIDRKKTLVVGHSEGALTASRVAAELPEVTHVAPLASAGATQLHGLVELAVERGKTPEEQQKLRDQVYAEWKTVQADPMATNKYWMGHPHRRWTSFCRHTSVQELLRSKADIYLAQGTKDQSSHISELDVVRAELAAHGRHCVVKRIDGVDHGYRPVGKEQAPGPPKEFMALIESVLSWFLKGGPGDS